MTTMKLDLLSKELLVARKIYELTVENDTGPMYFNRLVGELDEHISRATISIALDMLFDEGLVTAEWDRLPNGKHVRALKITKEAEKFVKAIYQNTSE